MESSPPSSETAWHLNRLCCRRYASRFPAGGLSCLYSAFFYGVVAVRALIIFWRLNLFFSPSLRDSLCLIGPGSAHEQCGATDHDGGRDCEPDVCGHPENTGRLQRAAGTFILPCRRYLQPFYYLLQLYHLMWSLVKQKTDREVERLLLWVVFGLRGWRPFHIVQFVTTICFCL